MMHAHAHLSESESEPLGGPWVGKRERVSLLCCWYLFLNFVVVVVCERYVHYFRCWGVRQTIILLMSGLRRCVKATVFLAWVRIPPKSFLCPRLATWVRISLESIFITNFVIQTCSTFYANCMWLILFDPLCHSLYIPSSSCTWKFTIKMKKGTHIARLLLLLPYWLALRCRIIVLLFGTKKMTFLSKENHGGVGRVVTVKYSSIQL